MLAPSFLRSLVSSPAHANMLPFFPGGRRSCWRQPPCEALFLRRVTPTCSDFSRPVGGHVGAVLPAKPYFFAGSRQHIPVFPGRSAAMLAPFFLRSLISSPDHANMPLFFPGGRRSCWRRPPCKALFLRRVTPTCPGFSRAGAGHVGAVLLAKPYFFAGSRQHAPVFPGRSAAMLAPSSLRSLISSPGHANMLRFFLGRSPTMLAPSFLRSLVSSPGHANMLRRHPPRIFPTSHFFYSAST